MTPSLLLRWLVVAYWVVGIAAVAFDLAVEATLPAPLRGYLQERAAAPFTPTDALNLGLAIPAIGLGLYGSVQLLRLCRSGRGPFAASFALGVLGMPLLGPSVMSGWGSAAAALSCGIGGVIIGWLYLGTPPFGPSPDDELDRRVLAIGGE